MSQIKVACLQLNVEYGNPIQNAEAAAAKIRELDVDLVVLPEAYLTGYSVGSMAEAQEIAIGPDHPALDILQRAADELQGTVVVGFAEKIPGGTLANSAAILTGGAERHIYRKSHLPEMGLDKFVEAGNELPIYNLPWGKLAVLICFDMRHPEATKCLALMGADVLALPTNWPVGAEVSAEHICFARAAENLIFVCTCNRVGEENGFRFIGRSKIIGPNGELLATADDSEQILTADLDLNQAREKQRVVIPGKYETNVATSRRPALYGHLTKDS